MADLNRLTSFGHLGARLGRDSFDGHQTIAPRADVLWASSRVPFFHLCDDWLPDYRCSVPIEKRDVYQPLIKFSFFFMSLGK